MERRLNRNQGFTIIEVLVAMVLLSIVAVPLARTFMDSFKFQARGQVKTEANKVIEYVTEQLKNETYNEFGVGFDEDIRKLAKNEISELVIDVDSIHGSKVSSDYEVKIDGVFAVQVQKGGVGTPTAYDLEMYINDAGASFNYNGQYLEANYSNGILDIVSYKAEAIDGKSYNILIDSSASESISIDVKKQIAENVKIYMRGDIKLRQYADPGLSREQKAFEQIKLGDKESLDDETEYLCEARITATNKSDDSIMSSMNVTFSVFIKNEDEVI